MNEELYQMPFEYKHKLCQHTIFITFNYSFKYFHIYISSESITKITLGYFKKTLKKKTLLFTVNDTLKYFKFI